MKNYLKVILPVAVVSVSVYFFNSAKPSPRTSDLLLQNIEALATNENSGNADCYGIGSVDCPVNGSKVKTVFQAI